MYTLYWGFKKIACTLYTYVLAEILQNGAKFIQNWHLVSKCTWRLWTTSDKRWKVQKVEIRWAYSGPKNWFLQLKHYIQRIHQTMFSTFCVKIHRISHVISETISHFSRHNSSVFLLAQTLHTFYKSSPSKFKFSTARVKVH